MDRPLREITAVMQQQLAEIKELKEGWHGDAPLIPHSVSEIVERALQELEYDVEPNVCPSDDGAIDVTWRERNLFVSIDEMEFVYNDGVGAPTQFVGWKNRANLEQCAKQLTDTLQPLLVEKIEHPLVQK